MSWTLKLRTAALALATALAVTASTFTPAGSAASGAQVVRLASDLENDSTASYSVTLVTGDVVHVERVTADHQAVSVDLADGREAVGFHQLELDGQLHVLPLDVISHIGEDRLDMALFNVDQLVDDGYHNEAMDSLPVILSYDSAVKASELGAAATPPGAQPGASLESVNAKAVKVDDASAFWASLGDDAPGSASVTLDSGIEKVWLDATVELDLDRSVTQIGAPSAWDSGLDGAGVTVAVLDTGVDQQHPDLAEKVVAAHDFSDSGSTDDRFGHGTHVAATIAGTGNASDGARAGVAPGSGLLAGKVLNDSGVGLTSWIIDGMEWAVDSGADIINMSLGGGPTNGTDQLSLAVNTLTEDSGALFVVSAGNSGPGAITVGSPGVADAALTVGAVDRQDVLADFSSRGPRWGDLALKPDITAPGVGIVAARASNTSMGDPVDEHYTAASGTSMSAPHVAGAAAILAQQHPQWTAEELKDGLISTALTVDGNTEDEQGGGRVDVARAVEQGVFADGTVHLGTFTTDEDETTTVDITYTNTEDHAVELDLDLELSTGDGRPPADGAVQLGQETVQVDAGSTASVPVVIDSALIERGRYTGYLTAKSGDVLVQSTLWLLKQPPLHTVNFTAVGPDGDDISLTPLVVFGEDARFDMVTDLWPAGKTITAVFGDGTYYVFAHAAHQDERGESAHVAIIPELEINEDADVVIDLRETSEVEIETPKPARQRGIYSYYAYRDMGTRTVANGVMQFPHTERLFVTPTDQVTTGDLEFASRWQLQQPMLSANVKGGPRSEIDLHYLPFSPALEGSRTLPLVYAGEGAPESYQGLDVRDAVVLITPQGDPDFDGLTRVAAEAGAAMAIFVPPGTYSWYSEWVRNGDRLPAHAAFIPRYQAEPLLKTLRNRDVKLRLTGAVDSPYLYDVMQVSQGKVPNKIVYTVNDRNSATVETRYHHTGGDEWIKEQRFGWRPWMGSAINQFQRLLRRPQVRDEIISADDTLWQHRVRHDLPFFDTLPVSGGMTHQPRTYEPAARETTSWFQAVVRPAIPRDADGLSSHREDDVMTIRIPEFADSSPGHYGRTEDPGEPWSSDNVTSKLYRDGELVSEGMAAWGEFPAVKGEANYRLDMTVQRDHPEWEFSTRTDTSWSFRSTRPRGTELVPLLQVDYDAKTNAHNRAPSGRVVPLGLTVRHQDGLDGLEAVRMTARASFDDGGTWDDVRVVKRGDGRFIALVRHPVHRATNGYVALQVDAEDSAGNSVEQTILRAYGLGGR
jgi:subtilisin family serine protease